MAFPRGNGASVEGSKNFIVELRQRAINKKAETIFAAAHGGDPEWLEDLRIHQIELEIQNEELRLAQADLERSRARYFDLYDQAPVGYATIDEDGAIVEMNVQANALLAIARGALGGHRFLHYIAPEDRDAYYLTRKRLLKTTSPQSCELRMIPQNGSPFWVRLEMSLGDDGSGVSRIVIVDIMERKLAELQLQETERHLRQQTNALQTKEEELRRSLNEKETLLKEVHHRVKNNLQIISSLLRVQGDSLKDNNEAAAALRDSEHRIVSMAHIHELLYSSQAMDRIDFADYAQTLVDDLMQSHNSVGRALDARLNTTQVFLSVDQAIPCGLILNELVTNALKYAYPPGTSGEIAVGLSENADGLVTLSVADCGVGLPEGFDWHDSKSLGLLIVDLLANQLGGSLAVKTDPGTAFTIEFPKEGKMAKAQGA